MMGYYCIPVWLQKHPGSFLEGFTKTQVSTLAVRDEFLVAGGFHGELICKVNTFNPGFSHTSNLINCFHIDVAS